MAKLRIEELQENVRELTHMVIEGRLPGLAIVGPGGLGKSHSVLEAIRESGHDGHGCVRNSHVSPLALYELLYVFKEGPILVLEDMEHVYRSTLHCGLLRSATWGSKDKQGRMRRRIDWNSTTKILEERELPASFAFNGGVVMIGNAFPKQNDFFAAVLTRMPNVRFTVPPKDVFAFMRKLVSRGRRLYDPKKQKSVLVSKKDCLTVIDYLEERGTSNLRVLDLALPIFLRRRRRNWRGLVDEIMEQKPQTAVEVVEELEQRSDLSTAERVKIFTERTGKSRATYYRLRRR